MGLCLRLSLIGLFATAVSASSAVTVGRSFQQADVCELLRESHEHLQNEYPNEYYDCHAHSRFFKMGSRVIPANKKPV
jgi:hypothetical protein